MRLPRGLRAVTCGARAPSPRRLPQSRQVATSAAESFHHQGVVVPVAVVAFFGVLRPLRIENLPPNYCPMRLCTCLAGCGGFPTPPVHRRKILCFPLWHCFTCYVYNSTLCTAFDRSPHQVRSLAGAPPPPDPSFMEEAACTDVLSLVQRCASSMDGVVSQSGGLSLEAGASPLVSPQVGFVRYPRTATFFRPPNAVAN